MLLLFNQLKPNEMKRAIRDQAFDWVSIGRRRPFVLLQIGFCSAAAVRE